MTQPVRPEPTEPEVSSCEPVEHPHLASVPDSFAEQHTPDTEPPPNPDSAESGEGQVPEQTAPAGPLGDAVNRLRRGSPTQWRGRASPVAERARSFVTPPDVWNEDRPALVKMWRYARYSEQFPPTGPARWAAIGYRALASVYDARDYTKCWLRERPARAVIVAGLVALAALFPPTRMLLTVLLTPAHVLIELITNY